MSMPHKPDRNDIVQCVYETPGALYIPESVRRRAPGAFLYMHTVTPGLERIAADECTEKLNAEIIGVTRGKVFFSPRAQGNADTLFAQAALPRSKQAALPRLDLKCADNIYEFIFTAQTTATREALFSYERVLSDKRISEIMRGLKRRFGDTCIVNAGIAGRHNYSRFEAAEAFGAAAEKLFGLTRGDYKNRDMELRLDIIDGTMLAFVKLTDASFRHRGTDRQFQKGALRPALAHALVLASGAPRGEDIFLDPFCGCGNILAERAAYPYKRLIGCDIEAEAVNRAEYNIQNLPAYVSSPREPAAVSLYNYDMRLLRLDGNSVDIIVTNPPWGGQIKTDDLEGLYADFLRLAAYWLKPRGRMVILTPFAGLPKLAAGYGFNAAALCRISLHGRLAYVYKVIK